eukprot:2484200-Amphidinium_carterae.1
MASHMCTNPCQPQSMPDNGETSRVIQASYPYLPKVHGDMESTILHQLHNHAPFPGVYKYLVENMLIVSLDSHPPEHFLAKYQYWTILD